MSRLWEEANKRLTVEGLMIYNRRLAEAKREL
jgi:hypothetical protein